MSGTEPAPKSETLDPTLPGWARGTLAILRTLGELLRHPISGAPGKGTVTVGTLLIGVCVLWFVWRVILGGGGETVRDIVTAVVGGLGAWQTMRVGAKVDRYQQGGYLPPPRPQYPPPYPSLDNRPPPGGQGWAQ